MELDQSQETEEHPLGEARSEKAGRDGKDADRSRGQELLKVLALMRVMREKLWRPVSWSPLFHLPLGSRSGDKA